MLLKLSVRSAGHHLESTTSEIRFRQSKNNYRANFIPITFEENCPKRCQTNNNKKKKKKNRKRNNKVS